MESVDAIAQGLVSKVEQRTGGLLTLTDEWDELKQDIAAALAAERAKFAANDAEDSNAAGRISHDEARQMVSRFINSHFNNPGEKARASIPARPNYDDDLRLIAYIQQQRERDKKFAAFADENGEPKSHCINCGTWWDRKERCPLCMGTHAEMVATEQAAEDAKENGQ